MLDKRPSLLLSHSSSEVPMGVRFDFREEELGACGGVATYECTVQRRQEKKEKKTVNVLALCHVFSFR